MSRTLHLVYIPFRGVGIDHRNDEWFYQRFIVFRDYTLKSLQAQTNKDFTVWMSFRPQDFRSPILEFIGISLTEAKIPFVFTFDGLMYHDDKFGGSLLHRLKNAARLVRAAYRNNTWSELPASLYEMLIHDKNKTLQQRLANSLRTLRWSLGHEYETVLLTRLDSDDMLHMRSIETIQHCAKSEEAILAGTGMIHNTTTGEVAYWLPDTNPPFHTIKFPRETFFDPKKHIAAYRGYKSHEDMLKLFPDAIVLEGLYCVTVRSPKLHISTTWNHPFRGAPVDRAILKEFGL